MTKKRVLILLFFVFFLSLNAYAESPYTGEATYEKMKKLWSRIGHQFTVLSPKNARTKFVVSWNGAIRISHVIPRFPGHIDLLDYRPDEMKVSFGTGNSPHFQDKDKDQVAQRLLKGYLPLVETTWQDENLEYSQLAFATLFEAERVVTGKETSVAFVQMGIKNLGKEPREACLWVQTAYDTYLPPVPVRPSTVLRYKNNAIYDHAGRIRMFVKPNEKVDITFYDTYTPPAGKDIQAWKELDRNKRLQNLLKCTVELNPQEKVDLYFKLPYFPLPRKKKFALKRLDFQANLEKLVSHWGQELNRGMKIEVPERVVNEIYKSQLARLFSSSEKDPHSGRLFYKTGFFSKYVIAHDVLALNALAQRGYHKEAGQYLIDSYLAWQGTLRPEGKFTSQKGFLSGPAHLEGSAWPVKNGFVLWAACEHYKLSRDRKWLLSQALPHILESCDWIKRERKATKKLDKNGEKVINYGCMPRHMISDWGRDKNGLWTEAWNYLGLLSAAEVLADIGHPRAKKLAKEAADYRECIRTAVKRATARADKIKLPGGETIPWVPHELNSRRPMDPTEAKYGQQSGGWGDWTEYADTGALWLVFGKVFEANEDEITWLLRFLEEYPVRLLYPGLPEISTLIVHSLTFSLPSCYYPEADAYFWRGEMDKHTEAFYSLLASLNWKIYMGRDHRYPVGTWFGPIADGQTSRFLRRMLLQEDGEDIWLARGVPKAWLEEGKKISIKDAPTYFGPMGYEIRSKVAKKVIEATIEPPKRNPPAGMKIKLRLRHPEDLPIKSVTVDGKPWQDFTQNTVTIPVEKKKSIGLVARF